MRKIIVVDSGLGRVGSSAMMGILKLMNVNLGGFYSKFHPASPLNKKGFFELVSIEKFLKSRFPEFFPSITLPSMQYYSKTRSGCKVAFEELLVKEFGDDYPIGFKFGKGALYPILNEYREVYSLVMKRHVRHQARSILRMWKAAKKSVLKRNWPLSEDFITKLCKDWNKLCDKIMRRYTNVNYKIINFDKLINYPVRIGNEVADFVGIESPGKMEIQKWIDSRMVHK